MQLAITRDLPVDNPARSANIPDNTQSVRAICPVRAAVFVRPLTFMGSCEDSRRHAPGAKAIPPC